MKNRYFILFLVLFLYTFSPSPDFSVLLPHSPAFSRLLPITVVASADPLGGFLLEPSAPIARGVWDIRFGLDMGSGAEPIEGPFRTAGASDAVEVDVLRVPIEVRYGLSGRSEIGVSAVYESDKGPGLRVGTPAGSLLDDAGLQSIRMFGKWRIRPSLSWMADVNFAGKNTLTYGSDGMDMGIRFLYGPRLGRGTFLLNTGILLKSGASDFNNNNVSGSSEDYSNQISFGCGYVCPFTSRWIGTFEFLWATGLFEGGGGVKGNDLLTFMIGQRFGFGESFFLDAGAGMGVLSGGPGVSLRLGLNWMLGAAARMAAARTSADWWAPTDESKKILEDTLEKARLEREVKASPEKSLVEILAAATEAFDRQDIVAAMAQYEAAVRIRNDDPVTQYNLATCYFLKRRFSDALPHYRAAAALAPSDVDSHLYLGYTYYYLKDSESAVREWRAVLEIDPSHELARRNLDSMGSL